MIKLYVAKDNRRTCPVCNQKIIKDTPCFETPWGCFYNNLNYRSVHFDCLLISNLKLSKKYLSSKEYKRLTRLKLLKDI